MFLLLNTFWSFTFIDSFKFFSQTCEENISSISSSLLTNTLCQQSCHLLDIVTKFFKDFSLHQPLQQTQKQEQPQQPQDEEQQQQPHEQQETEAEESSSSLMDEWTEFFSVNFYNNVMSMFLKISSNYFIVFPLSISNDQMRGIDDLSFYNSFIGWFIHSFTHATIHLLITVLHYRFID